MENSEEKKFKLNDLKKKFKLKPVKRANLGKKVMFLVLNTNNIGELYYGKIEDGFFEKGENTWFVGAQQPILIKDMFGFTPLFILRYDSPFPSENLHPIVPEFLKELPEDERNKLPTPRLLQRLLKMVILANVIKPKRRISLDIKKILIILAISFLIYYLFFMAR
ncbi:hypothetical protein DRN69_00295 [Candidatus Pacearchaeota archaeon]|nr:MAG: hypothetical protein DRN69_00295 [Candidatus Pacearchaeota archaeon]